MSETDFFKWFEELLTTPPDIRQILKERTRTWMILGRAAQEFVKDIFQELGYRVKSEPKWARFDLLAQKKNESLLIETKLRLAGTGLGSTSVISELFKKVKEMGQESGFYLVTFDRSDEVKRNKTRFGQYFTKDSRFDWVSIEDLLGLSNYTPLCGCLQKDAGIGLLKNWRFIMTQNTMQYFEGRGLDKPEEIASSIIKLADGRKELLIDDFDILQTLSRKIKERYPEYFESFAFVCKNCGKKYRMTPIIWSERNSEYVLLCPECRKKIEKVLLQVPITFNIELVALDTSAIIEGALSRLVNQKFFHEGIFVIIPEVVDQELEMMEKPHPALPKEMKRDLRRKFKAANTEIQKLITQDLKGLMQLKRHVGERLDENKIKSKIKGIDRHVADRLLLDTCREIGALLITKDGGLAVRAQADKINVFLITHSLS